MTKKRSVPPVKPEALLVELFQRSGYMRVPNAERRDEEKQAYKKGYEIRLVVDTKRELADVRRLLRQLELKGGKPFQKGNRWVQPIYGKAALDRFSVWLTKFG